MSPPSSVTTPHRDGTSAYITTPGRSRNMAAIRRVNTKQEVALRSVLHQRGYRFRKDHPLRLAGKLIRPDIAFTKYRLAIFVDGCFWHSCPQHGRRPNVNESYWVPKLRRNAERDQIQSAVLDDAGWTVLRFWEHEQLEDMLDRVTATLKELQQ